MTTPPPLPPHANGPGRAVPTPPPGTAPGQLPPKQSSGALAWGMGLIVLMCLPFIGSVIAAAAMMIAGLSLRSQGGVAAHNGVRAANWGLTYLVATIVLIGGHFGMLWYLSVNNPDAVGGFFPFGIIITVWLAVTLWHLVLCIWALVVIGQGRPFRGNGVPVFSTSR